MSLVTDSETAAEYVEILQQKLWNKGDHNQDDDISSIICMLDSPLFKQLLTLQESIQELSHVSKTQTLTEESFDITTAGELIFNEGAMGYPDEDIVNSSTLPLRSQPFIQSDEVDYDVEKSEIIEKSAAGRPIHQIQLYKPENQSLGFSVVGIKKDENEDLGIFVQDIQPGGIAAQDGQLQEGDQLLAINGQPLDVSHHEAIRLLQSAQGTVDIVLARQAPAEEKLQVEEASPSFTSPGRAEEEGGGGGGEEDTDEEDGEVEEADTSANAQDKTDMVLSTDWTQLEVIDLINDGTGLGFGIIGGRSTGVVVKTILPGGIADMDGHLRSGDHILQIGDVNVRGMSSEQVALVLRQSGSHVRLVVARSVLEPPPYQIPQAPIIPTQQLEEHMEHFNAVMALEAGEHEQQLHNLALQHHLQQQTMLGSVQVHPQPMEMGDLTDVDLFEVDLVKDSNGLGITIAGYVGGDNTPDEISGIFVKSITEGSAAALDGRVHINDQIIEVDGRSLQGFSNHMAVEVLRNTGQMVRLKLVRYRHGPKYDKLQEHLAQANQTSVQPPKETPAVSNPTYDLDSKQIDMEDIQLMTEDFSGELPPEVEASIKAQWEPIIGNDFLVVVAQLAKFKEGGGLGISLEGTVDVEDGVEVRPHHYIRSILPDGPVGLNGTLKSSDELLEVNGRRLLGLNHVSVVEILKDLPQHVRLVCARRKVPLPDTFNSSEMQLPTSAATTAASPSSPNSTTNASTPLPPKFDSSPPMTERLVKAKSEMALSTSEPSDTSLSKSKSRSLEPLTSLAMWSDQPVIIELDKGDRGLGFSILDYQDPLNPSETVIVIRSLVPGGVAQLDGRLVPGDRLIFVNDVNVEHATLDEAVQALKGAGRGTVKIGVAKPLPLADSFHEEAGPQQLTRSYDFSTASATTTTRPSELARFEPSSPSAQTTLSAQPDVVPQVSEDLVMHESLTVSQSMPAQQELRVDIPAEDDQPKPLGSDPAALSAGSLELSFAHSDTSSEHGSHHKRKDSFYESDDEQKTPRKASPRKSPAVVTAVTQDVERPPTYDTVVSSRVSSASPQPIVAETVTQVASAAALSVENTLEVSPRPDDGSVASSPRDVQMSEDNALPSYEEATGSKPEEPEVTESSPVEEQTTAVLQAPIAQLDSTGSDSDQIPSRSADDERSSGVPKKKPPPPVPPKPKGGRSLLKFVQEQDAPPPLPVSGPPPLPATPLTPPLRPVPSSPKTRTPEAKRQARSNLLQRAASNSLDQHSSSDLSSPPGSARSSAIASPELTRIPSSHEKTIQVHKVNQHLGLTVDALEKAVNGCRVKAIASGSAVETDGRIKLGDLVVAINNESLRRITNAQARAILRRSSLQGSDVSITYIPAASQPQTNLPSSEPQQSPILQKLTQSLISSEASVSSRDSTPEPPPLPVQEVQEVAATVAATAAPPAATEATSPEAKSTSGQKTLQTDGSPAVGNQAWGPPRKVELVREPGKSLGISIVGGRVDMFNVSQEHCNAGIFIKHVLADSPAGKNGTLKKGDRILEVNGTDVRNATHDEAVEVIRNSSSPIVFVVQSLSYTSCPGDLESNQLRPMNSLEDGSTLATQSSVPSSSLSTPQQSFEQTAAQDSFSDSEEEDEFGYTKKRIQKKYADQPGVVQLVDLDRGSAGMGLGLAGNKDRSKMSVFVAGIQPESPAAVDGRIQVGDELLEVNGMNLSGLSHLNASALIKGVTTPVVKLVTHRREDFLEHMAIKPLRYGGSSQFDMQSVPSYSHRSDHEDSTNNSRRESRDTSLPPATSSAAATTAAASLSSATLQTLTPSDVVQVIVLTKQGSQGLGFGIQEDTRAGRHGIYVKSVTPGGLADLDNQLDVGDEILEVGDKSFAGVQYDKAIDILRASQGQVKLKLRKVAQTASPSAHPSPAQQNKMQLLNTLGESSTDPSETDGNADPRTCPIVVGKRTYLEIEKGKTGLGLSIVGGSDTLLGAIIIHEVYENGAAARDGRLWAGDMILEVNNEDLSEATHTRALQVLRQTPPVVKMVVYRDESQVREEDILDVFSVDLMKRPGKGLGLSIVGKKNDVGIYISDIVKGGVAEADGRLMQGDQILAVNSEDMRNSTQEYAAAVLKTLMGKVSLTVGRLKAGSKASSRKNSNHGTSLKKSDSSVSNKSKGKHSKSASEDTSHLRIVDLEQDSSGSLGISIAGGVNSPIGDAPVIIASLNPSGPAAISGKLRVGDKILVINGIPTEGMSHDQVVASLKASKQVTLHVTQGEAISITGGQRSRQVSGDMTNDMTLKDVNIEMEDDGQPPQYKNITLNRGPEGLGFSIVGGHGSPHGDLPIYVKTVFNKGAAADEGTLSRGDQILSVNGQSLEGFTHEEAVNILKNTQGIVTLGILS